MHSGIHGEKGLEGRREEEERGVKEREDDPVNTHIE